MLGTLRFISLWWWGSNCHPNFEITYQSSVGKTDNILNLGLLLLVIHGYIARQIDLLLSNTLNIATRAFTHYVHPEILRLPFVFVRIVLIVTLHDLSFLKGDLRP